MGVITPGASGGGGASALIARQVLAAPAAQYTFSAIPQKYTDLQVVVIGRFADSAAFENVGIIFNGDNGAGHYNWQRDLSDVGAPGSGSYTPAGTSTASTTGILSGQSPAASAAANSAGMVRIYVGSYSGTTFWKVVLYESFMDIGAGGAPEPRGARGGGTWMNTAAVNSLEVFDATGGNFVTGTVFSLFGIS